MYCVDDNVVFCPECIDDHAECKAQSIATVAIAARQKIAQLEQALLGKQQDNLAEQIAAIESMQLDVQAEFVKQEQAICVHFDEQVAKLNQCRAKTLSKLSRWRKKALLCQSKAKAASGCATGSCTLRSGADGGSSDRYGCLNAEASVVSLVLSAV